MSLKSFHLVFILAAALLACGFGIWNLRVASVTGAHPVAVAVSFGVAAALLAYVPFFVRNMLAVSYL